MKLSLIGCALFVLVSSAGADTRIPDLQHNPFAYAEGESSSAQAASRRKPAPTRSTPPWRPVLRATIVAGAQSMANVAGTVLKIGQSYQGYTLVSVGRDVATFENNGKTVVLRLQKTSSGKR